MINLFDDEQVAKQSKPLVSNDNQGKDGLFRADLSKVSSENKKRGYRVEMRFLPNAITNPEVIKAHMGEEYDEEKHTVIWGNSYFRKSSHYVNIKELGINGYYDEPNNIDPKTGRKIDTNSPLGQLHYNYKDSKNAVVRNRTKMLNWRQKWYAYVLILNDEQLPENNGKIMILEFGKGILDLIEAEENGQGPSGQKCDVFSLNKGKKFVYMVKEKTWTNENTGKEVTTPSYDNSAFTGDPCPIQLPKFDEDGNFVKLITPPTDEDGVIKPEIQEKITTFILNRDVELEAFGVQEWTEKQQKEVTQIINYVSQKEDLSEPSPQDFTFDEDSGTEPQGSSSDGEDDDDWDNF